MTRSNLRAALWLFAAAVWLSACETEADSTLSDPAERDQIIIEEYLQNQGLNAQMTEDGLYYLVLEEGEGETPLFADLVTVHYEGWTLYGDLFEDTHIVDAETGETIRDEPESFTLFYQLAGERFFPEGMQEGVSMMKRGGRMRLYIPSRLAFGSTGSSLRNIPPNTVVIYEVELLDF